MDGYKPGAVHPTGLFQELSELMRGQAEPTLGKPVIYYATSSKMSVRGQERRKKKWVEVEGDAIHDMV